MDTATRRQSILLVEDTLSLAATYQAYLKGESGEVVHVDTGAGAVKALEDGAFDVVLLDLMLPDMDGLDILQRIRERDLPVSVVVITAHGSVKTAVDAMRLGAFDFLVKPFKADRLTVTVRNALEHQRLTKIVQTLQDVDRNEYCGFIGSSLPMQAVYRIIDSAAVSKATVFITGESGTGKEVCADAIHQKSNNADGPFVAINCGAIPRDLMESEIFGHTKGAFTGAVNDREGAARRADGGTLFFDEICEMDLNLQTKLLRFIQSGTFQKVGGSQVESTNTRFVCATNRDPFKEVAEGRFREDLFYRLHVIPVHLPALSERGNDVIDIGRKFLLDFSAEEEKSFSSFSPETEAVFLSYSWPGNIRQLQNVIRNAVVLNEGEVITADMLPSPLDPTDFSPAMVAGSATQAQPVVMERRSGDLAIRPLAEVEKAAIEDAINHCGGNIPKAAARLGVSPSTLYRKKAAWEARSLSG